MRWETLVKNNNYASQRSTGTNCHRCTIRRHVRTQKTLRNNWNWNVFLPLAKPHPRFEPRYWLVGSTVSNWKGAAWECGEIYLFIINSNRDRQNERTRVIERESSCGRWAIAVHCVYQVGNIIGTGVLKCFGLVIPKQFLFLWIESYRLNYTK